MNIITINNQKFEETSENSPISDGVFYKNKWYKPVETRYEICGYECLKEIDIEKLYLKKYNSFLNKNDEPLHFLSFKEGVTEAIKILKKIK